MFLPDCHGVGGQVDVGQVTCLLQSYSNKRASIRAIALRCNLLAFIDSPADRLANQLTDIRVLREARLPINRTYSQSSLLELTTVRREVKIASFQIISTEDYHVYNKFN